MPRWATDQNLTRPGTVSAPAPARTRLSRKLLLLVLLAGLVALTAALPASARYNDQVSETDPGDTGPNPWTEDVRNEVGIVEKVNSPVPMDLVFYDEQGAPIELSELFKQGRPVVLNLGYSRCPSICIQMRSELTKHLGDTGLTLGEDFIILNISIDPDETPEQSRQLKARVMDELKAKGQTPDPEGWRFLTGEKQIIDELTEALGYRYLYIPPQDEFGHPGVLVLADGSGTIRRYLNGTSYSSKTLRLSIVETSEGKVGSFLDKAFVTCFVWDPEANNYAATAKFIMMLGGGVIILFVIGGIVAGLAYEKRRQRLLKERDEGSPGPPSGSGPGKPSRYSPEPA